MIREIQLLIISFLLATSCLAQSYNKEKICGTDTIDVNYYSRKLDEKIEYKAFECTQPGKLGLRVEMGHISHTHMGNTKNWLGTHPGVLLGIVLVHDRINAGVRFKFATIQPRSQLVIGGDTLGYDADLNPGRISFYAGYSIDLVRNFSIELYSGITRHLFYVVNEKELNKKFDIPPIYSVHAGVTLNKYFRLKDFQFLCLFASFGYGFADYKKIHHSLSPGYSELSLGIAYKVIAKKDFLDRIR